jgi:hypothetical protein
MSARIPKPRRGSPLWLRLTAEEKRLADLVWYACALHRIATGDDAAVPADIRAQRDRNIARIDATYPTADLQDVRLGLAGETDGYSLAVGKLGAIRFALGWEDTNCYDT